MSKRVATGVVTSDKMAKSRRVEIKRSIRHPKYGKILHRKTVAHVHDENEESHEGDTVEIIECRPMSRTKRWNLVRVIQKSRIVDLQALRAASKAEAAQSQEG